ncbi:hypothetical protein [Desulfobotulus alkaliphilus]|uniref:hypothetical protein n=1 Tax=Desulfobotulus alkaliphilus TaxID=622671 RepID=UPI0011A5B506|nr:hypothetical protein [Desulfobotulus alkaliphilus]
MLKITITIKKVIGFIILFVVAFFLNQFIKMYLLELLLNSQVLSGVRIGMVYLFILSLPNIIFYLLVGMCLALVMQRDLIFWVSLYCTFELLWLLFFQSPLLFKADLFGYLLVYLPTVVIPLVVALGASVVHSIRSQP